MKGIVLALLAGSALMVTPGTGNTGEPREGWAGSRALPTAIAYYEFTGLLAETRDMPHAYAHLLADAFDVRNVDALGSEDLARLRSIGERLVAHNTSMQLEIVESRMRIVCTAAPARRSSPGAAYAAMNAADDISRPIQQKYLALTMAELPDEHKRAFRSFLNEFKSSVTYVKLDNQTVDEFAGTAADDGAVLDRACTDLHAEYARVIRDGGQ